jgi:DNA repair exonuclease SbcCD ATPase subunit
MRKSFAAVLATTALLAVTASATQVAAGSTPTQPVVPASSSSALQSPLTLAQIQQLITQLLGQSTLNAVQLQQLLTLLQQLQSSQTQLQGLLTQLTTLANSLPAGPLKTAVTQLISTLQSFLQPSQQLTSLINQLQTLMGQTPQSATQIKQVLQQIQQLLQPSQAQLTQLLSQLQQLFQIVLPAQLLQVLRQLFPELIDIRTNGKVTLCHKTGSKKKPYHKITLSQNALRAHMRHGDLPSVAGVACPTQVVGTANTHANKAKHGNGKGKKK